MTSSAALIVFILVFIFGFRGQAVMSPAASMAETLRLPLFVISAVPIATGFIIIVSLAANTGSWRGDFRQSSLDASAVRAWSAEAQGAYMARAWDASAALSHKPAKLAPDE